MFGYIITAIVCLIVGGAVGMLLALSEPSWNLRNPFKRDKPWKNPGGPLVVPPDDYPKPAPPPCPPMRETANARFWREYNRISAERRARKCDRCDGYRPECGCTGITVDPAGVAVNVEDLMGPGLEWPSNPPPQSDTAGVVA